MNKDQLLAVLDMSEDEQWEWCVKNVKEKTIGESLADLAFRLRDETKNLIHRSGDWGNLNALYEAQKEVYTKVTGEVAFVGELSGFWMCEAKPIHWIIAALIAKES